MSKKLEPIAPLFMEVEATTADMKMEEQVRNSKERNMGALHLP